MTRGERLISPEPRIILAIRNRDRILFRNPGPIVTRIGDFAEDTARQLRSWDLWVGTAAGSVVGRVAGRLSP